MNQQPQEFNVDEAQIGRILHYVIDKGYKLQCRPAIVVEDWPDQGKPGYVNLVVFLDGTNDASAGGEDVHVHDYGFESGELVIGGPSNWREVKTGPAKGSKLTDWQTSVNPNHAVRAHRTWHWPRECTSMHEPAKPYENLNHRYHHNHAAGVVDEHNCYACHQELDAAKAV